MALKQKNGKYKCMFCSFEHYLSAHVYSHMLESHDYVLVPMLREELVRLLQFIMTKDESLITEELYKKLRDFSKYRIKSIADE